MGIAIGPNPLHLDQALSLCFEELPDSDAQELLPVFSPSGKFPLCPRTNTEGQFTPYYMRGSNMWQRARNGNDDRGVQGLSPLFNVARPPF